MPREFNVRQIIVNGTPAWMVYQVTTPSLATFGSEVVAQDYCVGLRTAEFNGTLEEDLAPYTAPDLNVVYGRFSPNFMFLITANSESEPVLEKRQPCSKPADLPEP
jgi:hypothetical protein